MITFCDIHQHCLYGLDDGAQTSADMELMLRAAYRDRVDSIIVTPHCTPGLQDFQTALLQVRVGEAQRYCAAEHLPMKIKLGAEILFTPALRNVIRDRQLPTLGDSRYVLVEFVPGIGWFDLQSAVALLIENGYRPVIAHVERYRCLFWHSGKLRQLKGLKHVMYQVNCASLLHPDHLWQRYRLGWLLRKRLVDVVATDAHDVLERKTCMMDTYQLLRKKVPLAYANALVSLTPRRILNGG